MGEKAERSCRLFHSDSKDLWPCDLIAASDGRSPPAATAATMWLYRKPASFSDAWIQRSTFSHGRWFMDSSSGPASHTGAVSAALSPHRPPQGPTGPHRAPTGPLCCSRSWPEAGAWRLWDSAAGRDHRHQTLIETCLWEASSSSSSVVTWGFIITHSLTAHCLKSHPGQDDLKLLSYYRNMFLNCTEEWIWLKSLQES